VIIFDLPVPVTNVRFVGGGGFDRLETKSRPLDPNFVFSGEQVSDGTEQATDSGEQVMEFTEADGAVDALVGAYRITSNWEPSTSYLVRDALFVDGDWEPQDGHFLHELDDVSRTWLSMKWDFELVSPGVYRIRCQWGSESGYLTRRGEQDAFGIWQPASSVLLTTSQPEWASQRWAVIPTGDGGSMLVNMWGPSDGVLTRNAGGINAQGQYFPGDSVGFYPPQDWSSQIWNLNSAE